MRISDWSSDVCSSDLSETFTALLDGGAVPADPAVWESSRFALDVGWGDSSRARGLARATDELLAGMIEFSLSRRLTGIVTVTELRMERILRRAGGPLQRLGRPTPIDLGDAAGWARV